MEPNEGGFDTHSLEISSNVSSEVSSQKQPYIKGDIVLVKVQGDDHFWPGRISNIVIYQQKRQKDPGATEDEDYRPAHQNSFRGKSPKMKKKAGKGFTKLKETIVYKIEYFEFHSTVNAIKSMMKKFTPSCERQLRKLESSKLNRALDKAINELPEEKRILFQKRDGEKSRSPDHSVDSVSPAGKSKIRLPNKKEKKQEKTIAKKLDRSAKNRSQIHQQQPLKIRQTEHLPVGYSTSELEEGLEEREDLFSFRKSNHNHDSQRPREQQAGTQGIRKQLHEPHLKIMHEESGLNEIKQQEEQSIQPCIIQDSSESSIGDSRAQCSTKKPQKGQKELFVRHMDVLLSNTYQVHGFLQELLQEMLSLVSSLIYEKQSGKATRSRKQQAWRGAQKGNCIVMRIMSSKSFELMQVLKEILESNRLNSVDLRRSNCIKLMSSIARLHRSFLLRYPHFFTTGKSASNPKKQLYLSLTDLIYKTLSSFSQEKLQDSLMDIDRDRQNPRQSKQSDLTISPPIPDHELPRFASSQQKEVEQPTRSQLTIQRDQMNICI